MLITSAGSFFVLRIYFDQFMFVFLVCFVCAFIAVFWIHVALFLMSIVWLGSVFCVYHSHNSPGLRDSTAQTAERELQSAGPAILLTSVNTHFGCRPRGLITTNRRRRKMWREGSGRIFRQIMFYMNLYFYSLSWFLLFSSVIWKLLHYEVNDPRILGHRTL